MQAGALFVYHKELRRKLRTLEKGYGRGFSFLVESKRKDRERSPRLSETVMLTPRPFIARTATPYGYEIFVNRDKNIIDNYTAGNCAHDSVEVVPLNDPSCLSLSEIKKLARRTARDIADEYSISRDLIEFDN